MYGHKPLSPLICSFICWLSTIWKCLIYGNKLCNKHKHGKRKNSVQMTFVKAKYVYSYLELEDRIMVKRNRFLEWSCAYIGVVPGTVRSLFERWKNHGTAELLSRCLLASGGPPGSSSLFTNHGTGNILWLKFDLRCLCWFIMRIKYYSFVEKYWWTSSSDLYFCMLYW
jgi:hypothetical protein